MTALLGQHLLVTGPGATPLDLSDHRNYTRSEDRALASLSVGACGSEWPGLPQQRPTHWSGVVHSTSVHVEASSRLLDTDVYVVT